MKKMNLVLLIAIFILPFACSKKADGRTISFSLIRPPVEEVAGTGLTASASSASVSLRSLSPTNFQDRFFSAGPTNILNILGEVDSRLLEIAARAAGSEDAGACLDNDPTAMAISVFGETFNMQFQCYDTLSDTGLFVFGQKDDSWYIFEKIGASALAAKATTLTDGNLEVEVYGSVGLTNGTDWSSGSYGGYHIKANNSTNTLDFTVGGLGFGFCGSYLKSDATNIYIRGSEDGTGQSCQTSSSICVQNADLGTTGSCTAITESSFLLTALGRAATTNYSSQVVDAADYPSSPQLVLNGTSTDSVHFGPSTASDLANTITTF
jgi:hypothetical protein